MIRTRDFLLFALGFVFLLAGISGTILFGSWRNVDTQVATVVFADASVPGDVETLLEQTNYADNAERLRAQLLAGAGDITAGDPVFTSVDQLLAASINDSTVSNRSIQWCGIRHNDSPILASWPKNTTLTTVEGVRVVMADNEIKLQLPVPVKNSGISCIKGLVVGVTNNGQLIRNDEVFRYVAMADDQLIGWALDGFPIYGTKVDTAGLDACGGMVDGTYRYYLRASEDFILGCFAGMPSTVN